MSDAESRMHFREITSQNWRLCAMLKVAPAQEKYVDPNALSLAEAAYHRNMVPRAVYDMDEMVGFVMYDITDGKGWIRRFMIGAAYQHKGYGKWALDALIARLLARPDCHNIFVDFVEGNAVAESLYAGAGFRRTGETLNDGHDVVLRLDRSR